MHLSILKLFIPKLSTAHALTRRAQKHKIVREPRVGKAAYGRIKRFVHGTIHRSWMSIVGLDLAGVESRPTGLCVLKDMRAETSLVYTDEEVLKRIDENKPKIIAIDAPLSLPAGRESIEQKTNVHLRECDKELLRRGIKFFPITLGPMRKLTNRGINLRRILESEHFRVIEVYPGGAQDILGISRKQHGLKRLRAGLEMAGVKGLDDRMSDHELDAVTCALVGELWLERKSVIYGTAEQAIVMPKGKKLGASDRHQL